MSKRKLNVTPSTYDRYDKEGRSQGDFEDYKSGLEIHDLSSEGLSSRTMPIWSPPRVHNYFSRYEYRWLCYFDWKLNVIDIKDQFLLPWEETEKIARDIKVKHPADSHTGLLIRLSTDLVITELDQNLNQKIIAYDLKLSKDLNNYRTLEKFQIVKTYWKTKGIKYKILTEKELPRAMVENIHILRGYRSILDRVNMPLEEFQCIAHYLAEQLIPDTKEREHINSTISTDPSLSLDERLKLISDLPQALRLIDVTNQSDRNHNALPGTSLTIVYCLLANRVWECDMNIPFHEMAPFVITAPAHDAIDGLKTIP